MQFADDYGLADQRCLEVGCGRDEFQDLVQDCTGVDLTDNVARYFHKPFCRAAAERLPFDDDSFDVVWSVTVLEHVPEPQRALDEMRRVIRPGGLLFLKAAWHCRPWNCEGIPVRAWSELTARQRWIKATLPIRESLLIRAAATVPRRCLTLASDRVASSPRPLRFGRLRPDYEHYWMADSDAACSLDPFDVILWFRSRGDAVLSHPTLLQVLSSRHESLIVSVEPGRCLDERTADERPRDE